MKTPMLAASTKAEDLTRLPFPLYGSWKIDGVRAVVVGGRLMSRTMKPIPNKHCQRLFGRPEYEGLDGELTVGPMTAKNLMQATTSGVMSDLGEPDVAFNVFDKHDERGGFATRYLAAMEVVSAAGNPRMRMLPQVTLADHAAFAAFEEGAVAAGYEGVCLRKPEGLYKEGRSTLSQAWLLKVKRFEDGEATVVGATELVRKDGVTRGGCLGNLVVTDEVTGVRFEVGTGFSQAQREEMWAARDRLPGLLVKYQHFTVGAKDKPRFPIFVGFRDRRDFDKGN